MNIWLTIFGMALVTYACRALPLLSLRGAINPTLERFMRYVPPAIFAALITPDLLIPRGSLHLDAQLAAGLFGVAVAWFSRNMALTIAAGLLAFGLLRWLGLG